ncbi:hypothetical protein BCR33DRAFT_851991 [Rhizoclosmatium globosum]|uniref:sn-1-specific diacylglycerol lipase n=1 Tax=Rhizoclosmatium globosum TaxID=329046 RepID=A0A1Y2C4P9_9FUNG|nr:hypothetical protein BCR33DRAFT_851991 [Rhizoclosmatium globosum]|eukprot:ORY41989.1 hypothetical protein BCR33DRAFT_851991 [Rhizoclosmatium globosum]
MGRMHLLNRRVPLAPDDMYIPAMYAFVFHSVCTIIVYVFLRKDCNISNVLLDFVMILISTLSIQIPLDALTIYLSMSGSIAREGPRRFVSLIVHIGLFVRVWEFFLAYYGLHLTYGPGNHLQPSKTPDLSFYFIMIGILLLNSDQSSGNKWDKHIKVWQSRLNFALGTGGMVDSNLLREVSEMIADYFKDFDWAPSDVAAGLILLKREQKRIIEVRQARRLLIEQPDGFLLPTLDDPSILSTLSRLQDEEDCIRTVFMNGRRPTYMKERQNEPKRSNGYRTFALNTKTIARTPCIKKKISVSSILQPEELLDIIHFVQYSEAAYDTKSIESMYGKRVIFVSEENQLYKAPYFVVHDNDAKAIIIAIRGTSSAMDVLIDLKLETSLFDIPELSAEDEKHEAHSGFLHTARNIVKELTEHNLLGELLLDPKSEYYGRKLIVTGHSMGAGVAALVANILRHDFPSTHCYAYEPPGCVVSRRASQYFENFCTSIISRATWQPVKIRNGKFLVKSKKSGLLQTRTILGDLLPEDLETLKRRATSFRMGMGTEENKFSASQLPMTPVYLPGRILYFEKLKKPPLVKKQMNISMKKYHYVPRWARKEEFQEILVSRSMVTDHSPWSILKEFQSASSESLLYAVTRD